MNWVLFSLVYAIFNAIYLNYNAKHHFNGYVLGMIRGFGVFLIALPFVLVYDFNLKTHYLFILILQGVMIGIYDSHIFFSSSKYGGHSTSGFMALSVIVTLICWWGISFVDLENLLKYKERLISFCFIIMGLTVSYWQMMKVHINSKAEKYLYPAVFSLSIMSILTRYIAIHGKNPLEGIVLYLTVSCFVSGLYNLVMYLFSYIKNKKSPYNASVYSFGAIIWLVLFSFILITAKTLALRTAHNPTFVVAMLLLSPIFADIIKNKTINIDFEGIVFLIFIMLLIVYSFY